jgi:hypothetical protein
MGPPLMVRHGGNMVKDMASAWWKHGERVVEDVETRCGGALQSRGAPGFGHASP